MLGAAVTRRTRNIECCIAPLVLRRGVHTGDDKHLRDFRSVAPEICTSSALDESYAIAKALSEGSTIELAVSLVALQVPFRFTPEGDTLFDAGLVDAAHARGLAVHVWTINDEAEMCEVIATGVDGIMTDYPRRLQSVMSRQGVPRWR